MRRLTTDKAVREMGMTELAHNCCYAEEGVAKYRDFETNLDARDFARNLMSELTAGELPDGDEGFDEAILDNLQLDCFSDVRGLIALFYRNLWAMADLRETLKDYEDAEEKGMLLRLPCPIGTEVWTIMVGMTGKHPILFKQEFEYSMVEHFGKSVFLTKEEAEVALEKLRNAEKKEEIND